VAAIVDRAFIGEDEPPRTAKAFEEQKKRAKARLPAVSEAASRHLAEIVEANQQLTQAIAQNAALGRVVQDVKAARDRLVYPGFLARTPWERLEHLPRYLKGYALRLAKYRASAERDQKHAATVHEIWERYEARARADREAGRHDPDLEEYRWLVEELRVSPGVRSQVAGGRWQVAGGRWQVAGGRWQVAGVGGGAGLPLDVRKIRQFPVHTVWYAGPP
jgi:ATP-dependent helicase HrpA